MKNRITIGISSIVLIFLILCLSVFCLLSISDARSARSFAERHAASVQMYYDADAVGQTFIRDYRNSFKETGDAVKSLDMFSETLPEGSLLSHSKSETADSDTVICDIPMESGQTLHLELSSDGEQILSYYVYNSSEYVIDSRLPVWSGNE